jgi:hypothetical protein
LTFTVPLRTSTLTLWPRTGGPAGVSENVVVGCGPEGAGGGPGAGGAGTALSVVNGTSSPWAKPW